MQKSFVLFASLFMAVLLVGAGCADTTTSSDTTAADDTSVAADDAMMEDAMALYELNLINDELYDGTEGYKSIVITEEEGTCGDLGLTEFTYKWDDFSEYMTGAVTDVTDSAVVAVGTTENTMTYYTVPTDSGSATCEFTVDGEAFTGTCTAGGAEVCTGTFSGLAS